MGENISIDDIKKEDYHLYKVELIDEEDELMLNESAKNKSWIKQTRNYFHTNKTIHANFEEMGFFNLLHIELVSQLGSTLSLPRAYLLQTTRRRRGTPSTYLIKKLQQKQLLNILLIDRKEKKRKEKNKIEIFKKDKKNVEIFLIKINELYDKYPKKIGKKKGVQKLLSLVEKNDQVLIDVEKAINNYAQLVEGKDQQYIKHFSTFVNEYEDYVSIEKKKEKKLYYETILE